MYSLCYFQAAEGATRARAATEKENATVATQPAVVAAKTETVAPRTSGTRVYVLRLRTYGRLQRAIGALTALAVGEKLVRSSIQQRSENVPATPKTPMRQPPLAPTPAQTKYDGLGFTLTVFMAEKLTLQWTIPLSTVPRFLSANSVPRSTVLGMSSRCIAI